MKTILLVILMGFSTSALADPPTTCELLDSRGKVYLSAMNIDVHFAVVGDLVPHGLIQCNFPLRNQGEVLTEGNLWCRDAQRNTYGPYPVTIDYRNTTGGIRHSIVVDDPSAMDPQIGITSFEASYTQSQRDGRLNINIKGQSISGSARCW